MKNLEKIDLSIVLINYNTEHYLLDCIDSIYRETNGISFEVIVTDNNSNTNIKDTLANRFPKVRYHDMGYNAGFARANNAGTRISKGDYVLLLNDDTLIQDNAIAKALNHLKKIEKTIDLGFLCIKLMNDDRSLQLSSHQDFISYKEIALPSVLDIIFNRQKEKTNDVIKIKRLEEDHEAEWVSGAFLMANKKRYTEDTLYLDEDFLIYTEDVEVCKRARAKGLKNIHFSGAAIFHINSASYSVERKSAQLTISQWLYILKTKGYFTYTKLILNNYSSIFVQNLYYLKNKIQGKISQVDIESKKQRKEIKKLLNRYAFKILFEFKRRPSSSRKFLKFIKS